MDRTPSILLEWVAGVTLTEWIKSFHNTEINSPQSLNRHSTQLSESSLKIITQLAREISKALGNLHDALVTHNNLKPEHIVVHKKLEKDIISVKIIGLGSASLLTDRSEIHLKSRKDLLSLGSIFFEMFTGRCPFDEESDPDFCEGENDRNTFYS
eukprot:3589954-Ditylum_brightwellii.AAC.1